MKRKLITVVSVLLAVMLIASGCVVKFEDERLPELDVTEYGPEKYPELFAEDSPFRLILKDDYSALYISEKTTEFALVDLASGEIVYSNPQDRGEGSLPRYSSVIRVSYYDDDDKACEYNSYTDCNMKSDSPTVVWTKNEAGDPRLIYTLGKVVERLLSPKILSEDSYNAILQRIQDDEALSASDKKSYTKTITNAYKRYEWNNNGDNELSVEAIAKDYPIIKKFPIYVNGKSGIAVKNIENVLKAIGYTFQMMDEEYEKCEYEEEDDTINIRIALDYKLDNGALIINIPRDQIWINRATTKLAQVHVFEYLAAGTEAEDGSMFLPDGSGAIINWNNHKNNVGSISVPIYGRDKGVVFEEYTENTEGVYLPVYAQTKNKDGVPYLSTFVTIEKGAEMTQINAMISEEGMQPYNMIYPSFIYTNMTEMQYIRYTTRYFQKQLPSTDVTMRVKVLVGEDNADYVGMAKYYREYLLEKGLVTDHKIATDKYSLNLEFIGSADVSRSIAGIPVTVWLKLTGYSEAREILEKLSAEGVSGLNAVYTAWADGGYRHNIMDHLSTIGSLGSSNDLKQLFAYTNENGIALYPDLDMQYASKDNDPLLDGFVDFMHATRTINNKAALDYEYSMSIREPKKVGSFYLIKLEKYDGIFDGFIKGYEKYDNKYLMLKGLGRDLYTDFNQMYGTTRSDALAKALEIYDKAVEKGYSIGASGANQYSFKYADLITDAPVSSSKFYLADESVPFYNIVLHGLIPCYTIPLNTADDYMVLFLRAVETGSGLTFKVMQASNEEIKDIAYGDFYSMNFELWEDTIVELYQKAASVLTSLQDTQIVDHENVALNVAKTVYADGTVIYTNYSDEDFVTEDGVTVASMDFAVKGGAR